MMQGNAIAAKVQSGQVLEGIPEPVYNGLVDLLGARANQRPGAGARDLQFGERVPVFNGTGSNLDRFSTLALGAPRFTITNGDESIAFSLATPEEDSHPAILLEPIADGKFGMAVIHGLAIARVGAGSGNAGTPGTANRLTPGDSGPVQLLGNPSAGANSLLPVLIGGSGSGGGSPVEHAIATNGIPAKTGSTMGSANCQLQDCDDAGEITNAGTETIYNPSSVPIATGADILWQFNRAGIRVAIAEMCPAGSSPPAQS